jgi:hypothetical protein
MFTVDAGAVTSYTKVLPDPCCLDQQGSLAILTTTSARRNIVDPDVMDDSYG